MGALPHLVAVAGIITFNTMWLIASQDGRCVSLYIDLALGYALFSLLFTSWVAWRLGGSIWRTWQVDHSSTASVDPIQLAHRRQTALRVTNLSLLLSVVGWLPGTLLIPGSLGLVAGPAVAVDLVLSFLIAGLLALIYSTYAVLYLTLRVGYPSMWGDAQQMWQTARSELAGVNRELRKLQFLAVVVPFTAGLGLIVSQSSLTLDWIFRSLISSLLLLGMLGFGLTMRLYTSMQSILAALTGDAVKQSMDSR